MKKTISINLAGLVFNIEEQGYERLKHYLDAIRIIFSDELGASEIMEDIESRIAELFHERLSELKQAVTEEDVHKVILIMGEPNDYAIDSDETQNSKTEANYDTNKRFEEGAQRRLYRDQDKASVAGVCAGLGHYFNVDPVVFRLLFVLLVILGGSGILIYIILIIAVPEAKTTAEKLQMRGESVNIENIKEHVANFSEGAKNGATKATHNIKKAFTKGYQTLRKVCVILAKVIGVFFLIGGLVGCVVLAGVFYGDFKLFPFFAEGVPNNLYSFLSLIFESSNFSWLFLSIFMVAAIPLLVLFVNGLKLLTDWKYNMKGFYIGTFVLWVVSIISVSFYGVETGVQFKAKRQVSQLVELGEGQVGDTLIVDMFSGFLEEPTFSQYEMTDFFRIDERSIYLSAITLAIVKDGSIDDFEISYQKISNGPTGKIAYDKAQAIDFNYSIERNMLLLPAYYSFPIHDKIRGQHVRMEVRVPENKYVIIKNYDDDFPCDIQTKSMRKVEKESKDRIWTTKQVISD